MKRGGGKAGRPFGTWKIDQLEKHLKKITSMSDLHAIRAELGFRTTQRSGELKNLLDRIIREQTGTFNPNSRGDRLGSPNAPDDWWILEEK